MFVRFPVSFRAIAFRAAAALAFIACLPSSASAQPAPRSSYYWHPSLALQNISTEQLVTWLGRVGVHLPFSIAGNVSFSLTAGVPLTGVNDPRAYELDGNLSSPRLLVQGMPIEDFHVAVRYRDGVMVMPSLRFQLPKKANETAAPTLSGQGTLQLVPRGDLELGVTVENFDLTRLTELSGANLQLSGQASGKAALKVARADFSDPANFSGSATLRATNIRTPGLFAPQAEAAFRVADRAVTFERFSGVVNDVSLGFMGRLVMSEDAKAVELDNVRLDIFDGSVNVRGRAPLGAPTAQDLAIEAENLDLALLDKQLRPVLTHPGLGGAPPLSGRISFAFDGTVPFQSIGDYSLWRLRRTEVRSPRLLIGTLEFDNLALTATFDGTNFSLNPFGWDWPAAASPDGRPGRIDGRVAAQLTLFGRVEIDVRSTHTPARTHLALVGDDEWLEGFLNGSLTITAPAIALKTNPSSLATWSADLELAGEALRLVGTPIEFRRLQLRWRSPTVDVQSFDLALAASPIQGSASLRLAEDRSQLDLTRAQLMTAFGRASAEGTLPFRLDRAARLTVRIDHGNAAALSQILGPDVFNGSGPFGGRVDLTLAPAATKPRMLRADGELSGVVAGKFQSAVAIDASQTAADAFRSGQAAVDIALSVPLTIAGRSVTDAAIKAKWRDGVLDVSRFGAAVDGIPIGGRGRATLTDDFFAMEGVEFDVLGGKAKAEVRYPRKPQGVGSGQFTIDGVDLSASKPFLSSRWPRMTGRIDANGHVALPAAPAPDAPRPAHVMADLNAPKLAIGNWRVNRATANVRTDAGVASFSLRAETLDGLMEWTGAEVLPHGSIRNQTGALLASRGSLTIRNIHVGRLIAALPRRQVSDDLVTGRLSAALHYTRLPEKLPQGQGSVEIIDLANSTGPLSDRLESALTFDGRRLRLPNVAGDLLDGRVRGVIALDLHDLRPGAFYRGDVVGMSLPKFFSQIGANGDLFTGAGDIHVRGRLKTTITGSGTIEIPQGTFAGLDVSAWRSPAEIDLNLTDYSGRFAIPQTSAHLAQGQLRGNLDYRWDTTGALSSSLDFTNVNLRGLLRTSSRLQSFGEGRITGRLQLGGRSMRGLNDMTGSFSARLENTQPGSWPVFDQILSLLTGVGGRALVFDRGTLGGVIGSGATRFQRIELVSQRARVVGGGDVRFNGSLDMDFTAFTGRTSVRGRGGEYLAGQLLVAANPPAAILYRVNQLLSDRVIALKVAGTVSAPVTRVKPVPTLTAEAARFLLEGYIPTPGSPSSSR